MAWTSPRTWVAGEVLTAALLNTHVRDNLLELNSTASAWTAFTPTLTNFAATVSEARYKQTGKIVEFQCVLSLTAAPTGNLRMSLPVTARTSAATPNMGTAHGYTGTVGRMGILLYASTTTVDFLDGSGGANWNATVPFTWASGHAIRIQGCYEAT